MHSFAVAAISLVAVIAFGHALRGFDGNGAGGVQAAGSWLWWTITGRPLGA